MTHVKKITNYKGKKVAILGFGIEGESACHFLLSQGAYITVFDKKKEAAFEAKTLQAFTTKGVEFVFSDTWDIKDYDVIVRSPGIPLSNPDIIDAQAAKKEVTSNTKIFFERCQGKIIGVTGTKGKGTTSTLIYEMLKKSGKKVFLGGNIGNSPLTFLHEVTADSFVVLELSSFQLLDLTMSPHIAVLLMIVPEHMDYHASIEEYVNAKRNLIAFQTPDDYAVLNKDYLPSRESDIYTDATVFQITREGDIEENGCFIADEKIYFKEHGELEEVVSVSDIYLPGRHNLDNVMASVCVASLLGVEKSDIRYVLKEFKGLPHRLELVGRIKGVSYYDDSFSTTPETAMAAIEAFDNPKILILGGSSKNSDFSSLGQLINTSVTIKAIIGIGVEWPQIKATLHNPPFQIIEGCTNMEEIIQAATSIGELGDVVLLSPACASFDMFKNYKDRGDQFKEEVKKRIH